MILQPIAASRKGKENGRVEPFSPDGRYVIIDIEATSLETSTARVIELGAVVLQRGRVSVEIDELIDPCELIGEKATEITGITDDMVKGKQSFRDIYPRLLALIGSSPIVCHNAMYDVSVLKAEAARIGKPFAPVVYDTLVIARQRMKGMPNYKLSTLCAATDIDLSNAHRAAHDAEATAKLFAKLIAMP